MKVTKIAQGRMDRNEIEMYPSTGKSDQYIASEKSVIIHSLVSAAELAIPCLEDWMQRTGFGETYRRDKEAVEALKKAISESGVTKAPKDAQGDYL